MRKLLGLLLMLGICAAAASPAWANHVACGDTITASTTLDSDLTCTGTGIVIGANGITLDLGGHTVRSDTTAVDIAAHDDVTIRGGTVVAEGDGAGVRVRGFRNLVTDVIARGGIGIFLESSFDGRVANNTVTDATIGVFLYWSFRNTVSGNTLRRNAGAPAFGFFRPAGVSVWQSGPTVISGNVMSANAADIRNGGPSSLIHANQGSRSDVGVSLEGYGATVTENRFTRTGMGIAVQRFDESLPSVYYSRIERNVISRSALVGISLTQASESDVVANTVTHSGVGIELAPEALHNRLIANQALRNTEDGIRVGSVSSENGNLLEGNFAHHNGDDGISVGRGVHLLRQNIADHNGDLGIEVLETYYDVDGGGNRARHNGNPLQCLNVVCAP